MITSAAVVADSVGPTGIRITTLQLRYWRAVHAELMTHRVFSRNASSSRAIPVQTVLDEVWGSPAGPVHWGKNQPGMQAHEELTGWRLGTARFFWRLAAKLASVVAWSMMKVGVHKQVANRVLEPFQYISVIVTSTEWENFFTLRDHPDAQPEIRILAQAMKAAMAESVPTELRLGEWHLPYVYQSEIMDEGGRHDPSGILVKLSTARCARVSYTTHDGLDPKRTKDIKLHDRLVVAKPIHASPAEHQAMAMPTKSFYRNFRGWYQYRILLEK